MCWVRGKMLFSTPVLISFDMYDDAFCVHWILCSSDLWQMNRKQRIATAALDFCILKNKKRIPGHCICLEFSCFLLGGAPALLGSVLWHWVVQQRSMMGKCNAQMMVSRVDSYSENSLSSWNIQFYQKCVCSFTFFILWNCQAHCVNSPTYLYAAPVDGLLSFGCDRAAVFASLCKSTWTSSELASQEF